MGGQCGLGAHVRGYLWVHIGRQARAPKPHNLAAGGDAKEVVARVVVGAAAGALEAHPEAHGRQGSLRLQQMRQRTVSCLSLGR